MMHMTNDTRILIAVAPADFRKGIDGFVALCQNVLLQDPRSGTRFVFTNRSRTDAEVLTSFDALKMDAIVMDLDKMHMRLSGPNAIHELYRVVEIVGEGLSPSPRNSGPLGWIKGGFDWALENFQTSNMNATVECAGGRQTCNYTVNGKSVSR